MKFKVLVAALLIGLGSGVCAAGRPLACQTDARAGLKWENGKWSVKSFPQDRFLLVMEDGLPTKKSVAKAINGTLTEWMLGQTSTQTNCSKSRTGHITCVDFSGGILFFNPQNNKGGVTNLFGTTDNGDDKDTPTISAFTCEPF